MSITLIAGSMLVFAMLWSQVFLSDKSVSTVDSGRLNTSKDLLNWGIEFEHPISIESTSQASTGLISYTANYQLAQDQGKLISSGNSLFDDQVWNVQKSRMTTIDGHSVNALLLNSQYQDPITVVYWYCVESFCSAKPLEIVLYSGAVRMFKGDGNASVVAIASRDFDINQPEQLASDVSKMLSVASN